MTTGIGDTVTASATLGEFLRSRGAAVVKGRSAVRGSWRRRRDQCGTAVRSPSPESKASIPGDASIRITTHYAPATRKPAAEAWRGAAPPRGWKLSALRSLGCWPPGGGRTPTGRERTAPAAWLLVQLRALPFSQRRHGLRSIALCESRVAIPFVAVDGSPLNAISPACLMFDEPARMVAPDGHEPPLRWEPAGLIISAQACSHPGCGGKARAIWSKS